MAAIFSNDAINDHCVKFKKVGCLCVKCMWKTTCKNCKTCVLGSNIKVEYCEDRKIKQ